MMSLKLLLPLIGVVVLSGSSAVLVRAQEDDGYGRPCGFKIAPCPEGSTCSAHDASCPATRRENCLGTCVTATPACQQEVHGSPTRTRTKGSRTPTTPPIQTSACASPSPPVAVPTSSGYYEKCGGDPPPPLVPKKCPEGYQCIDDVRLGGCGMACDSEGICVAEVIPCAGMAGRKCPEGLTCYDDLQDKCDHKGAGDCGGICLMPYAP
jgi:hypothetical protein